MFLALIAIASFTSCTDSTDEDLLTQERQSVQKDDVDPRGNEDPEDPT